MRHLACILIFLSALSACKSGSSEDGGTNEESPTPTPTETPSSSEHFIGGEIIGLTGSISLQNNGADELTANADGPFTFETPLAEGATYTVTIDSQPSTERCFARKSTGTVASSDISTVVIDCRWVIPTDLSDNISPNGSAARGPSVAVDNNGNGIIVWNQSDGTKSQVFKSEYRSGSWTHPSSLSDNISPDGQSTNQPQVAMDNNGNAIIVWDQSDGSNPQIFKSEYRSGSWTHPSSLSDNVSPNGSNAQNAFVAMDDNGNAIIVWTQADGSGDTQVFKSEYRSGSWTHPSSLSDNVSPDGTDAANPDVAMDSDGNAIIVWQQWDGNVPTTCANGSSACRQIYKSEYRSGSWTYPTDLTDNITPDGVSGGDGHAYEPKVAMDNNGSAIIVWYAFVDSNRQIFRSEYRSGVWSHPSTLSDNLTLDTDDALKPMVSMSDDGSATIVWGESTNGSTWKLLKADYRDGTWFVPSGVSNSLSPSGSVIEVGLGDMAMDDSGNVLIGWNQSDGSDEQIFKSEYR